MHGSIYVENSSNTKLSGSKKVDATYVSIKATCSPTCPLKKNKYCYAMNSYVGMVNARLNSRARSHSPLKLSRAEAQAIDQSYHGGTVPTMRDLRLHVSGDSRTIKGTRLINAAIARWKQRGGGICWSYTHSWNHVPRREWSNVSILASIESPGQAAEVRQQGYAPALVVPEHKSDKAYTLPGSDIVWIPCPSQTRDVPCVTCRLCFNANRLYDGGFGIAFAAHGVKKGEVKRRLTVVK